MTSLLQACNIIRLTSAEEIILFSLIHEKKIMAYMSKIMPK